MPRSWIFPSRRAAEASPREIAMTGAAGMWGSDPIDGDSGWTQVGGGRREVPPFSLERARMYSVSAYRANPMARAIIDTYTSFAVGDSGCTVSCTDPDVRLVVDAWWTDPKNRLAELQEAMMRDWMLNGELVPEYLVGELTGVCRWSPIDPSAIVDVRLDRGNPLWPSELLLRDGTTTRSMKIAQINDLSGLREGDVGFFPGWRALLSDRRGTPFLMPILDDLDAYNNVLGNLIDRTALARYMVWDVEVKGGQTEVDQFVAARGGTHVPPSGSVEVHNENVIWKPQSVDTGSFEDTNTMGSILTNVAGGAGLAKTWLSEAEGANRATAVSMAEPVRRRLGGVQKAYLSIPTEMARYAVDRAVAAGRLPREVPSINAQGDPIVVPASMTVSIIGPEIAAADSTLASSVFLNLSQALDNMTAKGIMTLPAAQLAAQKAWELFVGIPFRPDLAADLTAGVPGAGDAIAEAVAAAGATSPLDRLGISSTSHHPQM